MITSWPAMKVPITLEIVPVVAPAAALNDAAMVLMVTCVLITPGGGGATEHTPAEHVAPVAQACAQPPQLFGSVARLASQPLAGLRSQSAKPASQVPMA